MSDDLKPFPIQQGYYTDKNGKTRRPIERYSSSSIPWWLAEEAYKVYVKKYGSHQSLERLAERGGFGREELLALLRESENI